MNNYWFLTAAALCALAAIFGFLVSVFYGWDMVANLAVAGVIVSIFMAFAIKVFLKLIDTD